MQVEKRHYAINLLLLIAFYLSFLPINIGNLSFLPEIILNTLVFRAILTKSDTKFIISLGTIIEIISSSVIGIFFLTSIIINKIISYSQENIKSINIAGVLLISSVTISISTYIGFLIKGYLSFHIDYGRYQLIAVGSIISILIVSLIRRK